MHDKESFTKEQSRFSGSKSLNRETISNDKNNSNKTTNDTTIVNEKTNDPQPSTSASSDSGFNKRLTVAELFLKESEDALKHKENVAVTETINNFDKMDLYKSIFLSDEEDDSAPIDEVPSKNDYESISGFFDVPKNTERNLSPPRGIFANIDFDEINSWKRNAEKKAAEKAPAEKEANKPVESKNEMDEAFMYGPKIPDNLQKRLEDLPEKETIEKPVYRSKSEREVVEVSSSSSDSWVEAKEVKSKKKKKKNKKHKKQKKSKHKKKDK